MLYKYGKFMKEVLWVLMPALRIDCIVLIINSLLVILS